MTAPGLTVVVPTHGRPQLLAEALRGLQGQTSPLAEVLVVDDVGDPATAEVVAASHSAGPSPVRLVPNPSGTGASSSRNAGAAQARTELLGFCDDDDLWRPGLAAAAVAALGSTGADLAVVGLQRYRADGTEQAFVPPAALPPEALLDMGLVMTGSNVVLRAAALASVGGFDPALRVFNDWDFFVRFVQAGLRWTPVPDLLAEWREHPGDRLSTLSDRRAAGIEAFLAKHRGSVDRRQRRDLQSLADGIRRRTASTRRARGVATLRLARTLGPVEGTRRLLLPGRASRTTAPR